MDVNITTKDTFDFLCNEKLQGNDNLHVSLPLEDWEFRLDLHRRWSSFLWTHDPVLSAPHNQQRYVYLQLLYKQDCFEKS